MLVITTILLFFAKKLSAIMHKMLTKPKQRELLTLKNKSPVLQVDCQPLCLHHEEEVKCTLRNFRKTCWAGMLVAPFGEPNCFPQ